MSNKNKNKRLRENERLSAVVAEQSAAKKKKPNNRVVPVDSDDSSASSSDEAPSNHANDSQHNQLTNSVEHNDQANDAEKGDLPVFTFDDMNKLLETVKKEMPEHDLLKFNTRLEKLDWNRVKLPNFTAEESKKLFYHAISYIRKFKTLTEIIGEAQQAASKPTAKMYRVSKGGQRPKHPSSSYMLFANEVREKLRKQNPNLTIIEIGKLIGEKWRQMSAAKKEKYVKKFEENKKVYQEEISKYNSEHSHPEKKKKEGDSKPRTPLAIYLSEKIDKENPDLEGKSPKERVLYYKNKYNGLSDKKKYKYIQKCIEAEEKFVEKLKETLMTSNVDYKSVLNKQERDIVEKMNGKPSPPPVNGYALFIKENMNRPEWANVEPKQKNSLMAAKWKTIDKSQKDGYNNRAKLLQEQFLLDMTNYVKNLPEKEAIELYMRAESSGIAKDIIQRRINSLSNSNSNSVPNSS